MAITRLNSLAIPAGTVEPADISYPLTDFSSTGIDDNASNTAITIDSTGHVKVGNTAASPDGTISIRSDSDSHAISIYEPVGANENWQIGVDADGDLGFYDSGSITASITFADGGSVGIGTTPDTDVKLTVADSGTAFMRLRSTDASGDAIFQLGNATDTNQARVVFLGADESLNFYTSDNKRMTISSTGNVGIGTSSAAGKLAISAVSNHISLIESDNSDKRWDIGQDGGALKFTEFGVADQMVLKDGNVGIGTTSPNGTLHVQKTTSELNINSANNFANRIAPVIIGDGDGVDVAILIDGNQIEQAAESNSLYLNYNSSATTIINVGGGNVAIGRTNPQELLHIEGGAIVSAPVSYAQNQDQPYLIAASANYTGANTHWGTYGIQHRVKTNSGGTPRITVDTVNGEVFSLDPNGNMNLPLGEIQDVGTVTSRGVFRGTTTTGSGTPTFSFDGDTDTGIYHVATNILGFTTGGSEAARFNTDNELQSFAASGVPTIRNTQTSTVANNGTVDFSIFSGMIIINTIGVSGDVAVWVCGSGQTTKLGSSTGTTAYTLAYVSGINGYRFTNTSGQTNTYSFMAFQTRPNA